VTSVTMTPVIITDETAGLVALLLLQRLVDFKAMWMVNLPRS